MTDKMIRFLKSIGIENIDDFDIDFISCQKSKVDKNFFIFNVKKITPWNFGILEEFKNGLLNIKTYNYSFSFIYQDEITLNSLEGLIEDAFFNLSYEKLNCEFSLNNSTLQLTFTNKNNYELFTKKKADLDSLLRFINYNYSINVILNETATEEEPKIDMAQEIKNEEDAAQADALKRETENYKLMLEERRHQVLFKRGGYQYFEIENIDSNSGAVDFNGYIFEVDIKDSRSGKKIAKVGVANEKTTSAIYVTIIENKTSLKAESFADLKLGTNIRIKGRVDLDRYKKDIFVMCHYFYILPESELRDDTAPDKRVELHLHTKMSEMDAVTTITDYCKLAKNMGHKAIAVTDHGVVQAFPEAQTAAKKYGLKMLYGCELYLIDDYLYGAKKPSDITLKDATYVCFDLESTGLSIKYDRITEFGAVKIRNGLVVDRLDILINPEMHIPDKIAEKTKIDDNLVKDKNPIRVELPRILEFMKDTIIVSHNIEFDYNMLNEAMVRDGFGKLTLPAIDTLALSRYLFPEAAYHSLGSLCKRYEINYDADSAHRADYDAEVLANCWLSMRTVLTKNNANLKHKDLYQLEIDKKALKHLRNLYHATVLCKNRAGLKDLYKLVSFSHVDYMGSRPLVPKSLLKKYRSNLLVGSACFNSEVFYSSTNRNMEALSEAISHYDFIEIQPLENYSYLVNMDVIPSEDMLKRYLLDIINEAKKQNKIIVATGDCHYRDPKDKCFRDVYISNQAVGGVYHPLMPFNRIKAQEEDNYFFENPDQHFRSTDEMLKCFAWLGEKDAYDFVVKNTNYIADQCEEIIPIPDKLFTPTIDNCENLLKDLCFNTAKNLYGDIFNTNDEAKIFIRKRLETELDGIISNGFSVIYYIAHELVKKSNDDGYLVGSRGSVGSSFAATMAGITEVNALPPHYRCPHCKKVIFYKGDDIKSGYDLPEMYCPDCGTKMISDGQNIPFQTFLGFQAEKVPDIDLNFPTDYQATAHQYTKVLLGADKVYRAGTISAVQFKTAYGYVRKYFEMHKVDLNNVRNALIAGLAYGCQDVKRTTGQHPGGIVVIPRDYDVYDFTPVQYPAGDVEAAWKTTHFDFHSIHDTILKLDMLGHVDPQALKMMSDLTKIDCRTLPFNDKKVLSLFSSDEALGIRHKYMEPDNGAIGLPEFGTNFVRQMLRETKPKTFSDLLIISGLSHGTDVWTNNAQDIIKAGQADLRGVIGCRDDIMSYLISKGIPGHDSFVIMEAVRKGKKLKPEWEELMKQHGVPDYYIDSCNKIKYLFPKGHACAYVMMALRVGYYKIYYPLAYYATFFTLRCEQYDIGSMIKGIDGIHAKLQEYDQRKKSNNPELALSNKEEEIEKTLIVALEMAERGYIFENIDVEKSDGTKFIVDEKNKGLIPPFKVIDGFGEKAAEVLIEARNEKPFTSKEDLQKRGKVSAATIKALEKIHALDNLKEDDNISLFDFNF